MGSDDLNTDVLILGSGIAGLTSAIKIAEAGLKTTIVTREEKPETTNTNFAQGGIIYSSNSAEDVDSLISDICLASADTTNIEAAKLVAEESTAILKEILIDKVKTNFAKDDNEKFLFTKEAAHSKARIIYDGDMTGKSIQISLLNYLSDKKQFPNVEILTAHTAIDLITPAHHGKKIQQRYEENKVVGAYIFDQKSERIKKIISKSTILATGGISALYLHNTNSNGARGDGHAMAKRAGAIVTNMEFVQFHPTTLYTGAGHRRFLISETVRGEGGVLVNSKGEAFMEKYHPDMELAPRDIVARAISDEMISLKDDYVYLDITKKDSSWLESRFPTIFDYCKDHKIDIANDLIPVVPAAHYTCGGVKSDLRGRTNLKYLYAVGEVACTGLHGANRLASTSLLEGITFGYLAAVDIIDHINDIKTYPAENIQKWHSGDEPIDLALVSQDMLTIKQTMWNYVGLTRSKNRLARAGAMFKEMSDQINKFYKHAKLHDELIGLRNAVETSFMVLNASQRNKESIGCFYLE